MGGFPVHFAGRITQWYKQNAVILSKNRFFDSLTAPAFAGAVAI